MFISFRLAPNSLEEILLSFIYVLRCFDIVIYYTSKENEPEIDNLTINDHYHLSLTWYFNMVFFLNIKMRFKFYIASY
jgi:hypothetical protein